MIDKNKYEGHTPVEIWQVVGQGEPEDNGEYGWHIPYWMACNKAKLGNHKADALLIADAPLLLAEVERLRKESEKKGNVLSTLDEMIRNEESHVEMMKALEQGLDLPETWKEMIE